ncbi:unnamed protein product [Nippostrongylus brasiliensis]|uniref:G_PROTEIN_RECEP_F1_2 domain-containing protein n=1 Tax=Nippostrongylus brasiliensis TaxID=27835 RepID=A0A0N4YCW6_NIPBR|nr:unnamed protein product [Nippostrongylus brasiliensis]
MVLIFQYSLKPAVLTVFGMLLCFLCLYESIGLAYECLSAIRMLTNSSTMQRSTCFYQVFPYIFTLTVQAVMTVMLALDLLLLIVMPIRQLSMSYLTYAVLAHIPCVFVAAPFITIGFIETDNTRIIACNPPLALPPVVSEIWNYTTMGTNVAVIFIYFLVVIRLQRQHGSNNKLVGIRSDQPSNYKKMLWSTLTFVGAGISRLPFTTNMETQELIHTYAVLPPLLIMSQNYYVYYCLSSEFRPVFQKMLSLDKKGCDNAEIQSCGFRADFARIHNEFTTEFQQQEWPV